MRPTLLAALSGLIAVGAVVAYVSLLRVPFVRNHPEGYVVAFAVATVVAGGAVARARRRWPPWIALALSSLLLVAGGWFNFVAARVPSAATTLRVGQAAPDFTLTDAGGRTLTLSALRGKKPVVLVFYRGYW